MNEKTKWIKYEKRWKWREIYFTKAIKFHIMIKYFHREPVMPYYARKWVMGTQKTNDYIYDKIMEGKPFMACRFGNTELQSMVGDLAIRYKGHSPADDKYLERWYTGLGRDSGFFPVDYSYLHAFTDLMLESCKHVDLLAMWHLRMEDFIIEKYVPHADLTFLLRLEPWLCHGQPWTAALKGKKVLVIHPFENSIRTQYAKRNDIWKNNSEILPAFKLKTLKAVQTVGGEKDERFETWFDALEYMFVEAVKIDFDVAIIGCGAYGFPLAAKLKAVGKQVIHLGGATQLMFGIRGHRWDKNYPSKIATFFNDAWIYPDVSETPINAKTVERGCYWA